MPAPTPVMTILRILVPLAALVCLLLAGLFLYVQFTFSYRKKNTAKTAGILLEADHRKNVTIRTRRRKYFVKDLIKARYVYTVNGAEYTIRHTFYFTTKRQTPKFVPVTHHKRFPRFAYIDEPYGFGDILYGVMGLVLLVTGVFLCAGTVEWLVRL